MSHAPPARLVATLPHPIYKWVGATELAERCGFIQHNQVKVGLLYKFFNRGVLVESVLLKPHHKRYYRLHDDVDLQAFCAAARLT